MKKKIVLIVLAVVLLLSCGIGAWLHFRQPEQTADTGWRLTSFMGSSFLPGALSDHGYYYIPKIGKMSLHYMDFHAGESVVLCSQPDCEHDSRECEAYIDTFNCEMFYYRDRLYYVMGQESILYRRDSIGLSLAKVGTIGKRFIEQQKSVNVGNMVPVDGWAYYQATVSTEDEDGVNLTEMKYIGRINLSTGKDEILVEETGNNKLMLYAARSGSVLYARWDNGNLDPSDPDYIEKFRQLKVKLECYDPDSKSATVLFEKERTECQEIHMVWDDKVYCANYPIDGFTNTFVYDLKTGEYTLQYENAMLRHIGGGYAFYREGQEGEYEVLDMKTGKLLEIDCGGQTPLVHTRSDKGVILRLSGKELEDGSSSITYYYTPFEALADGLQETDLIEAYSMQTSPSKPQVPTTPTEPEIQGVVEGANWSFFGIDFTLCPQPPEENIEKNIQYLPETVENPGNLPVLKWVFAMPDMDRTWTEDAVRELNQMLADRKKPFRVQFVILMSKNTGEPLHRVSGGNVIPYDDYALLASEEGKELLEDADLIFGYMTPAEMQTLLAPITQYVNADGETSLQNSVAHRLDWITTTVDGEIYGIKQCSPGYNKEYYGWSVDKELMEKAGLRPADFQKEFWEMDTVLAKLYMANGNRPIMNTDSLKGVGWYFNFRGRPGACLPGPILDIAASKHQLIGAVFAIDDRGEKPTVVNVLETARIAQEAILRYRDAGYIGADGTGVGYFELGFSPEPSYREATKSMLIPVTMGGFETFFGEAGYGINGIAAVSQHKEEAAMLLNLLAEDEAFRDQFLNGKEGRDYQVEDGQIVPVEKADNACYTMAEAFGGYGVLSNKKMLQNYRDKAEKTESVAYPVVFDYTGYEKELEQIAGILNEIYPVFFNNEEREYKISIALGLTVREPKMDEALYDRMLEKLNEAGAQTIIEELQRQLDEWLANNPDWQ